MIINYTHTHSGHCESGVTSNMLSFYGMKISEPMAFGIGSGFYFAYFPFLKAQEAPLFAFRSLPSRIFKKTTTRLGVKTVIIKKFTDKEASMKALDRNLEKGIPTGMQVGVFNLKYFPPEYRMHYNFHNIVVFGKEDSVYYVSEPVRENTQLLAREDLVKARFAKGLFGPNGKMYYIVEVPDKADLRSAIAEGIRETAKLMVRTPMPYIGVSGIRKLSKDLQKWPNKKTEKEFSYYLMQLVRSIEDFGTGGAGFRYMYGAFLKEAGDLLKHEPLQKFSGEMGRIADTWRDFSYRTARFIKNRSEPPDTISELSELLMKCANLEHDLFQRLGNERI